MPLHSESHEALNISNGGTVLTYTHSGNKPLLVVCRVKAGSVSNPIAGSFNYEVTVDINGTRVAPNSLAPVLAQTEVVLQSRDILLNEDDIIVVRLQGAAGDTAVDTEAMLVDRTPLTQADVYGAGEVPIDHNYGGTDALRVTTPENVGVGDVTIVAYLKSDYDAGNRTSAFVRGRTSTGIDGRWTAPLMLEAAQYTLTLSKPGVIVPRTATITVTG